MGFRRAVELYVKVFMRASKLRLRMAGHPVYVQMQS